MKSYKKKKDSIALRYPGLILLIIFLSFLLVHNNFMAAADLRDFYYAVCLLVGSAVSQPAHGSDLQLFQPLDHSFLSDLYQRYGNLSQIRAGHVPLRVLLSADAGRSTDRLPVFVSRDDPSSLTLPLLSHSLSFPPSNSLACAHNHPRESERLILYRTNPLLCRMQNYLSRLTVPAFVKNFLAFHN